MGEQRRVVAHQQLGQGAALVERIAQRLRLQAVAIAGALHDSRAHGPFAGEHRHAHHALMADHGDFRGGAIFHHVQQRDDGRGGEIHVFQLAAVFEQFLAEWQLHQFQVLEQRLQHVARQRGQQLAGLVASRAPVSGIVAFSETPS